MGNVAKSLLGPAIALTIFVGKPFQLDFPKEQLFNEEDVVYLPYPKTSINTETKFSQFVTTDTVSLPFVTRYINDPSLELGKEAISQPGKEGLKKITKTEVMYENKPYDMYSEEEVLVHPLDRLILKGTKIIPHILDTEIGQVTYKQKLTNFWATSYDSTCTGCDLTTATGMKQGFGVVAVDPKVIPLYSKLYIPGYGKAIAGDVGGSIKGNRIDLGYDSLNGQWKAHNVDVYLLAE
jgi:3D (Asp-Asp-Asp) domain-containing protein